MSDELKGSFNPLAKETPVADKATIRQFVKDLYQAASEIREAKTELRETILSMDDIQAIDDQIKELKDQRKKIIEESSVIQSYADAVKQAVNDKRQLISGAKQNGVPKDEIDLAIRALKKDIDISASVDIYANIADLVE
jgi:SMC interacting uncharacterized protein involved in chromosome segregation